MLKNATYLSPSSQNERIDVLGKDIIRTKFVGDIKEGGYHSISADEVTASNDEVLSVCFRYVDKNKDIQEVFVGFVDLERITGNYIGQKFVKLYIELGIDFRECRGQCYDDASNM